MAIALPAMAQVDRTLVKGNAENPWVKAFKGSFAQLDFNMGSGTFVSDKYSDNPYVSNALTFYPRFNLAKAQSLRLYWVLECEYTATDSPAGRYCDPSDIRLSYHHNQIYKDPLLGGIVYGMGGLYIPSGYASQANGTVTNVRASLGYLVNFFKDKLEVGYNFTAQKYIPTDRRRGDVVGAGSISAADAAAGSTGSGSPYNDNWLLINNAHLGYYFTKALWVSLDLLVYNYFRYSAPDDFLTPEGKPLSGRSDATWGIFEVSYQPLHWLTMVGGISSYQPALTADSKSLRFPFYDFISPANNNTKWYLGARFTL